MKNTQKFNNDIILGGSSSERFFDKVFEEHMKQRKIILNDEIGIDVIEMISLQIIKWNGEDKDIPVKKRKPIKIYINSNGGDVISGFNVVDIIQNSKTPVIGIVMGMAYSMGALILLSCPKRYAYKNSTVLIHDGNAGASGSGRKFQDISKFYEKLDDRIKTFILTSTTMSEEFYENMADRELYMFADEAKEYGIIHGIIGVDVDEI
jgi:ATP-dependent Clp protease protease subunit